MANRGNTTSNWSVIFGVVLVSGTIAGAQRMGAQASPSVAVSGVICVDEGHDGRCDADDGTVALEHVELIGPDGSTLALDVTGEEGPGYEYSGLPVLPVGERYRLKHDRSSSPPGGLELATAGGIPVADPSIGIAVARELPNDGDRDDTLDFTLVRVGSWVRVVFADDSKSPAVLEAFTETPVTFFVANVGTEPLIDITARAHTPAALPGLTCDFAELGGPPTGADWAGPLEVGDSFSCRGVVPGLAPGERHFLLLSFLGSGAESGDPIAEIGEIDREGAVPDVTEPTTTTAPPTPTIDVPATSPPPTAGSPGETLPETGLDGWAAVVGGLAALAGILLVLAGRATDRDLRSRRPTRCFRLVGCEPRAHRRPGR